MTCASKRIERAVRMGAEADSTEELWEQSYVLPARENQPSVTDCLASCIIQSPCSIWLGILCVLLAMMLAVCSCVSPFAYMPTMGASTEDPEAVIVSGTISQQRDAVLANFARYGNRTGKSVSRLR